MKLGGGAEEDFLHVAPAEVGVRLKHQGDDAGGDGGRCGSAAEGLRVVLIAQLIVVRVVAFVADEIGGDDAGVGLAGGGNDKVRAAFAEGGGQAGVVGGADGDDVDVGGVSVLGALVVVVVTVAGGPDVEGAETVAAGGGAVGDRTFPKGARAAEDPGEVVNGAPAVVLDLDGVVFPVHGLGFILVGRGQGDQTQAVEGGLGGDAGHSDAVVAGRGGESGDGGAVIVIINIGGGVGVVAVPVVVAGSGGVGREVGMGELHAVVHNADVDAGAEEGGPDGRDVDVDAGGAALLAGVVEVPLAGEQRVVGSENRAFGLLDGEQRGGGDDVGEAGEESGGAERLGGVALDLSDGVTGGIVRRLPVYEAERSRGGAHGVEVVSLDVNPGGDDTTGVFVPGGVERVKNEAGLGAGFGAESVRGGDQGRQVFLRSDRVQAGRGGTDGHIEFIECDGVSAFGSIVCKRPYGVGGQGGRIHLKMGHVAEIDGGLSGGSRGRGEGGRLARAGSGADYPKGDEYGSYSQGVAEGGTGAHKVGDMNQEMAYDASSRSHKLSNWLRRGSPRVAKVRWWCS